MLTVSNRWDGDSRLSKGNKWASFPSVAAAWRISDEAFMKNVEALSNLKLRLSWGKTGNSGIMAYGTQSGLTPKTNSAFQDNGYTYYIYNEYVGNENVGWEMSNTWIWVLISVCSITVFRLLSIYTRQRLLISCCPVLCLLLWVVVTQLRSRCIKISVQP